MPVQVLRPDGTVSLGNWAIVGPTGSTLHGVLSDNNDATYIKVSTLSQLAAQVATMTVQDVSLPAFSKIFAVRVRIRQAKIQGGPGQPPPPQPRPHCGFLMRLLIDILTMNIQKLFRDLFDWRCPTKPSPKPTDPVPPKEWATVELSYSLQDPAGNEWTQASFNDFNVFLGRFDTNTTELDIGEVYIDLDYNVPPTCVATGPTASVTDFTKATVTWTYSDPEGDKQDGYWVRIFTPDIYNASGFDPEKSLAFDETISVSDDGGGVRPLSLRPGGSTPWLPGEDVTWTSNRDLPNGVYRAYVKVKQAWSGFGTSESQWSYIQWTQAVPGPVNPTLAATYDIVNHRTRIDLSVSSITPATATYNIEYSDDAGANYKLLRDGEQVPVTPVTLGCTIYDNQAPSNRLRRYRAQGFRILNTIKVSSGFSNTVDILPRTYDIWLKDPLSPGLNMIVPMHSVKVKQPGIQGIFSPLTADNSNQQYKIVTTGPRYGVEGVWEFAFVGGESESGWEQFDALCAPGRTLFIQYPTGKQHFIAMGRDLEWEFDIRRDENIYNIATISYTEVREP